MAKETDVEHVTGRVVSISQKKLNTPKAGTKAASLTASAVAGIPVLLYSHTVLPPELRTIVDEKWDACWPVSTLKPLALLDLLCYLLFIKKLEEKELITVAATRIPGVNHNSADELSWSGFKDMDSQNLHRLFTNENGISDLIINYGRTNLQYSTFLKEPLLLTPTATLLFNLVAIIKIMDAEGKNIKAAIFEYLLNKTEIETQNGQIYAPDRIVKFIIDLMQPLEKDLIWDPSMGNGSFLVNSARYIQIKNAEGSNTIDDDIREYNYSGIECDPIQLRIGAMNMILHGIEDPVLKSDHTFDNANLSSYEQPTLVFSNLFFDNNQSGKAVEGTNLLPQSGRPEIRFLNLILKTLGKGGRGAIIVSDYILSNYTTEIKNIRQQLIDDHKLEAVISLTSRKDSLFSGASIIIFSKLKAGNNDKVWFYKMNACIKSIKAHSASPEENNTQEYAEEFDEMAYIIKRWNNVDEQDSEVRTDNSFYVSISEIKNNNYNLCFSEYRKIEKTFKPDFSPKIPVLNQEIIKHSSIIEEFVLQFANFKKLTLRCFLMIRKVSSKLSWPLNLDINRLLLKLPERLDAVIKKSLLKLRQQVRLVIRKVSPGLIFLALLGIVLLSFYFVFSINKNKADTTDANKTNLAPGTPASKEGMREMIPGIKRKGILSQEQIRAIIYDTTAIVRFDDQSSVNLSISQEDSTDKDLLANDTDDIAINKSSGREYESESFNNALPTKYIVRDTTFFHNKPDVRSRRKSYLDPLNKNILNPIDDKNGFIYIVYTNHFGRTSKGWINKKDLMPLR